MRHGRRIVEEERPVLVRAEELPRLGADYVGGVDLAHELRVGRRGIKIRAEGQLLVSGELGVVQRNPPRIVPEMLRIIVVSDGLTVVAEEAVKTLLERIARAAHGPQPPLAETARRIAQLLETRGNCRYPAGTGTWPSSKGSPMALACLLSRI